MVRARTARPRTRLLFALAILAVLLSNYDSVRERVVAQGPDPCVGPSVNPIACENSKTGNPSSEWEVTGAGSTSIQGFATEMSVNKGQTIGFKVDLAGTSYRIDLYRLGYYAGLGARKIATLNPTASLAQNQPNCLTDGTTGLVDCGNWKLSASWAVPTTATSGVYIARLVRTDGTAGASHVPFVVRDDDGHSDLLFQTSDTTWQAYNQYGGNSLYVGSPAGRAYMVSYNRPITTRGTTPEDSLFNAEYPMIRWLEANGYNVSYFTGVDTDRLGAELLEHKTFLSVGHDEYWSGDQRTNVEAARAAGVHLAFFSGNEVFWKTRWENSIDGSATPYRTLVSYKETHANAKIDPQPTWTGTWRDPRFSPPSDGGRPENALTGTIFTANCCTYTITVPAQHGKMRFWRNTSVATLAAGQTATLAANTLGYEWDEDLDNGFRPGGLIRLSSTTVSGVNRIADYGSTYGDGTATHTLTFYTAPSGAKVFGAGTVQWSWGLDGTHDRGGSTPDVRMRQATVNLFADMGVQPSTLQSGLTAATASTDTVAPTTVVTSPASGVTIASGQAITIAGTASDTGGLVAAVEVSTDGGATWRQASGTTSWTYAWIATGSGSVTIRSRGIDDSGNIESPGGSVTITVPGAAPGATLVAAYGFNEGTGTTTTDQSGHGHVATLTSATWTTSGKTGNGMSFNGTNALLTIADSTALHLTTAMTLEAWVRPTTLSSWRTAIMKERPGGLAWALYAHDGARPAGYISAGSGDLDASGGSAIAADTWTHLATTFNGSTLTLYVNGVATASRTVVGTLASSTSPLRIGGNTVWGEYFAGSMDDVRIYSRALTAAEIVTDMNTPVANPDSTPPTVASVAPAANATNVALASNVTVTFNEAMSAASIDGTSFQLRDSLNQTVSASVTYDAATFTATLDPTVNLSASAVYTVTVRGGATEPRVKDAAGNALAATSVWSFSTVPPGSTCPCSLWTPTNVPALLDAGDGTPVEVGLKLTADRNGFISGIRFYKSDLNTGVHVGSLWTSTGTLLAQAAFAGETANGWQQLNLPSAVAVTANTVYVVSYYAPSGHYSADASYFDSAFDKTPLHALANGTSANGVFAYAPSSAFPNQPGGGLNYWVDVVFVDSVATDTTPPVVSSVSPAAGSTNVPVTTAVTATFNEAMNPATISSSTVELRTSGGVLVPSAVTYDAPTRTVTVQPSASLGGQSSHTLTIRGGATDPRAKDTSGNALAANFTASFTTASGAPPNDGPGGPILVIASTANPFGRYYGEILLNEGLNLFTVTDISLVNATMLNGYDVVILGEQPLTAAQVTMFTGWVNAGGNLVAMRPDKQLATLLGLTDSGATASNQYLLMNTSGAAAGLVNQTIQYHGTADRYTLNGATSVATLYSNATTATSNPAVTLRSVGGNGGQAAAFVFDLAKSIVYTRQGNPAWAGQERDGTAPIRSDDMFFGARTGDVQPDWVDLSKVAIPQADEQQRLLANLILQMNSDRKPLPRFWYLPRGLRAAVVMTGDDHGIGGTIGRWESFKSQSPANCVVDDWQCIRGTSYVYPNTPITNAQAVSYAASGFELGLHLTTQCLDFTPATLEAFYTDQLSSWTSKYTGVAAPSTNRVHCIAWSDWASQAKTELAHGIRFDTTYYYWPGTWILDRPGMFTGSGMPMRFADLDGTIINVYQAASQLTDESNQTWPFTIDTLLDRALGAEGYYGVFTANMHTDNVQSDGADAIVASAKARGVPVVSSQQMLTWLDGRNGSSFAALGWTGGTLTFTLQQGTGANGLQALVPAQSAAGPLSSLTRGGSPVSYTTQTIKGVSYAVFTAAAGSYSASYVTIPPPDTTITSSPASSTTSTTATFTFTSTPAGATFQCSLDGAAFVACAPPATYTSLGGGNHSFQVAAVNAGGPDPTPASYAWTITGAPPDTTIASGPTSPTTSTSASFSFTSTPSGATFECALDGAVFAACTSPQAYSALGLGTHTFQVRATNLNGTDATPASLTWTIEAPPAGCPCSLWPASAVPAIVDQLDVNAVELGVKFTSDRSGYLTAIRFYKAAANTGTHVGHIWTTSGTSLGAVTFTGESASGWQQAAFQTPIPVVANTTYIASYYAPVGHYSADPAFFNLPLDRAPLHAPATATTANGVYQYGPASAFPNQTYQAENYWVDVVFVDTLGPDTTPPSVVTMTPAGNSTGVSPSTAITAVFTEDIAPATITSATFELRGPANVLIPATVSYNATTRTATLQPSSALSVSTAYTARLLGGTVDPVVEDVAGNALASTVSWSFTTSSAATPVTAVPSAVTILTGTLAGGTFASLSADDNQYYQVASTTTGTRTATWYGSFNVPNELGNLTINYRGRNSASSVTQTIAIWRWTDSTWVQLDSRTVSTTEVAITNLIPAGALADYVNGTSGAGELRIRVMGTRTANFTSRGDRMWIVYNP